MPLEQSTGWQAKRVMVRAVSVMVTATQRAMGMTSTQAMATAIRVANNEEGYCKGGKSEGNGIEEGNGDKMGNGNSNNRGD
jgi:hypothetical protein